MRAGGILKGGGSGAGADSGQRPLEAASYRFSCRSKKTAAGGLYFSRTINNALCIPNSIPAEKELLS